MTGRGGGDMFAVIDCGTSTSRVYLVNEQREILASRYKSVGVRDTFGRSGKVPQLLELYGLTAANIAAKARAAVALKK